MYKVGKSWPSSVSGRGKVFSISLGFQTPPEVRYLDPKNIPKTPCQEVFGCLGCFQIFNLLGFVA